jgi:N-acetylglutamate synthase-like GNAT family acetyltransferase
MSSPSYQVRRATLDDLPALVALWQVARLPVLDLERHLTEFQLVVRSDGPLVGAIAVRAQGHHGKLHSEAFFHPEQEEEFRPLVWERIQTIGQSRGLARLWTQESAPFWRQAGFEMAEGETLKKLPPDFGDPHNQWLTLQLRDETALARSLDKEFEVFKMAQQAETEKLFQKARFLKILATFLAVILFGAVAIGLVYLVRQSRLTRRP